MIIELVSPKDEWSARTLGVLEIEEYLFKERFGTKHLHQDLRYHICLMRVLIILQSIRYNVCTCHSPIYHYITATAVYLIQRFISACVVVM